MSKKILTLALLAMTHSTFAFEASSQLVISSVQEVMFSTAITSITSEVSSYSVSDAQKREALKIQAEVQEYNQTGYITLFLSEKIAIVKDIDSSLSIDESVDVLIAVTESILSK